MSVRPRKDRQLWIVDVKYRFPDGTIERVRESCRTRRGAERREREIIHALEEGTWKLKKEGKQQEQPNLSQFAKEFLENYAMANNKPSEIAAKESILRVHLIPTFGKLKLDAIGPRQIEHYKAQKLKQGQSSKSINNHLGVLSKLLAVAVEWKIIDYAPRMKRLKEPPSDFDFLDFDEAERLLSTCAQVEPTLYALLHTVLKTGMRTGEFLALRWSNVDLVSGKIRVCENFVRGRIESPKSNKIRVIELGDDAIAVLKDHRHLKSEVVFCADDGSMMTKRMLDRPLQRMCLKAGLRPITWRDLRHTFASHLVMLGAPLKTVQELLGHADIKTTMRYAHLSPNARRDAAKLLDRARQIRGTIGAPSDL